MIIRENIVSLHPEGEAFGVEMSKMIALMGWSSLTESFSNNLLAEDRYKMILDGLQVTLLITLCAAILGTLLGGLVCWVCSRPSPLSTSWWNR